MGLTIVAAVVLLIMGSATTAYASICNSVDTRPDWDNNITNGWFAQAQTFEAPAANCNVLSDWTFDLAGRTSPGQVTFYIYQWGASGAVGSPLFTQTLNWRTTAQSYTVNNIIVALTPGQLYGADVDLQGYGGQSVYFNGNKTGYKYDAWWYNPNSNGWNDFPFNQYFAADFSNAVPEPGSILLLGTSMLGAAGILRRRMKL